MKFLALCYSKACLAQWHSVYFLMVFCLWHRFYPVFDLKVWPSCGILVCNYLFICSYEETDETLVMRLIPPFCLMPLYCVYLTDNLSLQIFLRTVWTSWCNDQTLWSGYGDHEWYRVQNVVLETLKASISWNECGRRLNICRGIFLFMQNLGEDKCSLRSWHPICFIWRRFQWALVFFELRSRKENFLLPARSIISASLICIDHFLGCVAAFTGLRLVVVSYFFWSILALNPGRLALQL